MKDNIPYDLITKFLAGECSEDEKVELESWKKESVENAEIFEQLNISWSVSTPPTYTPNTDKALEIVSERLDDRKQVGLPIRRMSIAIAAVIFIAVGLFGLYRTQSDTEEIVLLSLNEAEPAEYVLPDGSTITMNKGSMLTYPEEFSKNERRITFKGEAYFSISSDEKRPFIIESGNTETTVVGTEFNLISRADTMVQVIVTEGKVALSLKENTEEEIFIEPGQVGEFLAGGGGLEKRKNRDRNFLSWKSGILQFDNQDIKSALAQISRHYNVDMVIDNDEFNNLTFTAVFNDLSIEEVTESLQLILDVEINQNGNTYVLK